MRGISSERLCANRRVFDDEQRDKHQYYPWHVVPARRPLPWAPSWRTTPPQYTYGKTTSSSPSSPPSLPPSTDQKTKIHTASRDVRSTPSPKATYSEVHSDDITSLSFHPTRPQILISGSTDGLASVHDTSIPDEDELTVQTLNHNASIHDAAFLNDTEVFALSHDECFAVWDVAEDRVGGDAVKDFGDL